MISYVWSWCVLRICTKKKSDLFKTLLGKVLGVLLLKLINFASCVQHHQHLRSHRRHEHHHHHHHQHHHHRHGVHPPCGCHHHGFKTVKILHSTIVNISRAIWCSSHHTHTHTGGKKMSFPWTIRASSVAKIHTVNVVEKRNDWLTLVKSKIKLQTQHDGQTFLQWPRPAKGPHLQQQTFRISSRRHVDQLSLLPLQLQLLEKFLPASDSGLAPKKWYGHLSKMIEMHRMIIDFGESPLKVKVIYYTSFWDALCTYIYIYDKKRSNHRTVPTTASIKDVVLPSSNLHW